MLSGRHGAASSAAASSTSENANKKRQRCEMEADADSGSAASRGGVGKKRTIWKMQLRNMDDELPQDWWFASTAIPLLAATIGPLANVLSIAALVTTWRVELANGGALPEGTDDSGKSIPDPKWEIVLNSVSLVCGFLGNFALLCNFTRRIRYVVALPLSIIMWYFATGILIAVTISMNRYAPPIRPGETYSQGFWHAVIAAVLYMIGSMILMVNMVGYFRGHYPQHFDLDDDQRTLILQTMMFFFWLAGGAGVFARVCGITYVNALYFCEVTVLTVGFGDIVASNDVSRGLVFPYSVIGIIFLGLMINSIRKFALNMSKEKVIRTHAERERERTYGRSVTSERELRDRLGLPPRRMSAQGRLSVETEETAETMETVSPLQNRRSSLDRYGHFDTSGRTIVFREKKTRLPLRDQAGQILSFKAGAHGDMHGGKGGRQSSAHQRVRSDRAKLILLKEEKDRFIAMRGIQAHTKKFQQYYALSLSVLAFGILWCLGAMVFYFVEKREQDLSYFEALYFCYVSLLTIGYGDFSPRSNAGKPFFIVWSVVAVPTMTILVSDLGDTIVAAYNRGTFTFADWTVMPKQGVWLDLLESHPRLKLWIERRAQERQQRATDTEAKQRIGRGFELQNPDEEAETASNEQGDEELEPSGGLSIERLAEESPVVTEHELARKLALAIKRTANDLRHRPPKRYTYEEWVEFTRLIRFSSRSVQAVEEEEGEEGLVEWDWIGEDSPMLANVSESEWVLDRLCESLNRYTRRQARLQKRKDERRDLGHAGLAEAPLDSAHRGRRRSAWMNDEGPGETVERNSTSPSAAGPSEGNMGTPDLQAQFEGRNVKDWAVK